jgi:HD-like signal output (HDOD) protein
MLKAANTPILGRGRHITSVHQAISLLGVKNVISLVSGLVLRTRLTAETPPALEQFWDNTLQIAMISSALCDRSSTSRRLPQLCPVSQLRHGHHADAFPQLQPHAAPGGNGQ